MTDLDRDASIAITRYLTRLSLDRCSWAGAFGSRHPPMQARQMQHRRRRSPIPRITLAVLIGLIAGCHNPTDLGDPLACQQTYEFGNTGCFEVAGQVIGSRGQALAGISVGARPVPGPSLFNSAYQMTDSAGSFRVRLFRIADQPSAGAVPDTFSVYVTAADPRSAGFGSPATIRDSVLTIVTVAPVGTIPEAAQVRITLPVP